MVERKRERILARRFSLGIFLRLEPGETIFALTHPKSGTEIVGSDQNSVR